MIVDYLFIIIIIIEKSPFLCILINNKTLVLLRLN